MSSGVLNIWDIVGNCNMGAESLVTQYRRASLGDSLILRRRETSFSNLGPGLGSFDFILPLDNKQEAAKNQNICVIFSYMHTNSLSLIAWLIMYDQVGVGL